MYDRKENIYLLSGFQSQKLEMMEYYFIQQVLLDSRLLRVDEAKELLSHLASNTENNKKALEYEKYYVKKYKGPNHNKAIMKVQGDLVVIIKKQVVIKLRYRKNTEEIIECNIIPCMLHFDSGYLYLITYKSDSENKYPAYLRLDRIYSFFILRKQTISEKIYVKIIIIK